MRYIIHILRFGWPHLRRYRRRLLAGVMLGILFAATNALLPWLVKITIERLAPGSGMFGSTAQLGQLQQWSNHLLRWLDPWLPMIGRPLDWRQVVGEILFVTLPILLRGVFGYLSAYCMGWVSERTINDMRAAVLVKFNSLSLDFFNRSTMGDLITRVNDDTGTLYRTLTADFADIVKQPATLLGLFVGLWWMDWQLTLLTGIFVVVYAIPMRRMGRRVRHASQGVVAASVTQSSLLLECLSGIRIVKAFGLEDQQVDRYRHLARDRIHHGMKSIQARELTKPLIECIAMFGLGVLVIWIIGSGRHLANMGGFLTGVMLMQAPIKRLADVNTSFQQASVSVDRLDQIFREQPSVKEHPQPKHLSACQTDIRFDNVTFAYADRTVLDNVNLVIPRGMKLGIAGESGSGKSTLVNLLFRFYDPTRGRLLLDGVDLRELAIADHRKLMALVSQEIVLFDKTVAENIAFGRPGATRDEIEDAARHAHAYDFIRQLPQGFDTRIGERGVTLSGGQRQRLAIARAFVRNAPILVLDEATASLDSQSEAEVQAAIDRLAENRTVISIAHRLSTLATSDKVVVLSRGKIVEEGPFDQLLRTGGAFAAMAQRQGITASR